MQYREDPRSGNRLSVLGFGCMRFPTRAGKIVMEKAEPLLLSAYRQGVNYFDTAYLYGSSEATLGQVLSKHGIREKVYIATKLPQMMCRTHEDIEKYFAAELERLRTDYIDYYLLHNITSQDQWQRLRGLGIEEWVKQKKASGAIRQFGFSFHGPFAEFVKMLDGYDWDFVQIQYNYINEHYQAGVEGLQLAAEKGLPVIVMEPLLGGKLADALPGEAASLLAQAEPGSTPVSWALRWVWNHPAVTLLLSGMNEPAQLEENLALAEGALPDSMTQEQLDTVGQVVDIFNRSYKIRCTGCNYCMPCPKGINIPGVFAAYNASYAINWRTGMSQYVVNVGMGKHAHFASDCVTCGQCEKQCPQGIAIPQGLKAARRRLQIPGMPTVMKVAAKVMG